MRLMVYLLLFGSIFYLLWAWGRSQHTGATASSEPGVPANKSRNRFRGKRKPGEIWVQVYETAGLQEARMIQARIQEEDVECILYEQGKKDIHGNSLKGVGIAVPKTAVLLAQNIISRMPV